jgi:hypothetical protein
MGTRRIIALAAAALFVGLVAAPAAWADSLATPAHSAAATSPKTPVMTFKALVRVVAATYVVAPWTRVSVPSSGTITDSLGNSYAADHASALGALAAAADRRGFTFETGYGGDYVSAIDGLPSWMYAVNGAGYPNIDVGAFTFHLRNNDRVVFYQSPTFTPDTQLLDVHVKPLPSAGPGPALIKVTVRGDALSAPNSVADAKRFGVSAATVVAPKDFPLVTGATIHVGSNTYVDGANGDALDGSVTVAEPAFQGSFNVWAEKATDADLTYVRSNPVKFPPGAPPAVHKLAARPNPYTPGSGKVHVSFTLSAPATVSLAVLTTGPGGGTEVASLTNGFAAGHQTLVWNGQATGGLVAGTRYRLVVTATDIYGRSGSASTLLRIAP